MSNLMLRGARVNKDFYAAIIDASNRAGVTPNEFCITAAAEKLLASGRSFPGVFFSGDFDAVGVSKPAAKQEAA